MSVSLDFLCYHLHQMPMPMANRTNNPHVSQHQCAGLAEGSRDLIREFRDQKDLGSSPDSAVIT